MGKIIIGDPDTRYEYTIPLKEPSDEKEIINHEFSKREDQYWRTPQIKRVKYMTPRERIDYIERERQRWEEGVYVLIDGELVYFTGMFYDHLTYMTFKGSKAEYFDHQRYDFYFRDLTRRDIKCKGRVIMKPRRYGATMQEVTESTYTLLENFSNNVGLQSDTKDKARTTLLEPIIQSYVARPKWMRSDYYRPNGKLLVSLLSLNSNMAPPDEEDGELRGDYLLGWLKNFPSLPRSMDGNEMAYIVMSEIWKWQESSPEETLGTNKKVLMGRGRAGKVSCESTMGDSDDYARAVKDGCSIIAKSNPRIRDNNGYTLSELFEWFVPAIYSFDIPPDIFETDKFGKVNIDKHTEYIYNKLIKLDKKSKEYVYESRRLPMRKTDALLSANMNENFRRIAINSRLQHLESLPIDRKPYVVGNLEEDVKGKVWFVADPEGIWLFAVQPYVSFDRGIDTRNRFTVRDGVFFPPVNPEGAIGYDPINYPKGQTTSGNLSDAAIIAHKKFDYYNKPGDDHYSADVKVALCVKRFDDPRDANKECIKLAKFLGYQVMHEKSVSHVYDDFKDGGMLPFLLKHTDGTYGISQSNDRAKKDGLAALQTRYSAPKTPEQKDQIEEYPFERGLRDLDEFDINNTTPCDVTMAEIYCEHGLKQVLFTNVVDSYVDDLLDRIHEIIPLRQH